MGCGRSNGNIENVGTPAIKESKKSPTKKQPLLDKKVFIVENKGAIRDFYTFGKTLGKGTYGEVIEAVNIKTNQKYAVKILQTYQFDEKLDVTQMINEFKLIKELDHPNIVKIYETFEEDRYIYFVLELLTGGELFTKLLKEQKFSINDAGTIIGQVLQAISYLHSRGICHRDIKPQNILLESREGKLFAKLADFGCAKLFKNEKCFKDIMGTPYFMAPEILKKQPYSLKVDIWSLGVMTFLLSTGRLPFLKNEGKLGKEFKYESEIVKFVLSDEIYKPFPHLSSDLKDFINHCLDPAAENRWDAVKLLDHPWIKGTTAKENLSDDVLKNVTDNMKKFNKMVMLEKAVLSYLALSSTKEDELMLRDLYLSMDSSHDGKLNLQEFIEGFKKVTPNTMFNPKEIEDIFHEVDANGSGKIGYTEFIQAAVNKNKLIASSKLFSAFQYFDLSGDGKISKEEIKEIFFMGGVNLDGQSIDTMIAEIDSNKDEFISFEEFRTMMNKMIKN